MRDRAWRDGGALDPEAEVAAMRRECERAKGQRAAICDGGDQHIVGKHDKRVQNIHDSAP